MPHDLSMLNNKAAVANLVVPFGEEWRKTLTFMSKRTGIVQNLSSVAFNGEIRTAATGGTLIETFTFVKAVDNLSVVAYLTDSEIAALSFDLFYYDMFYTSGAAAPIKWMKGTFQVASSVTLV